jgi:hypothetical protein
MDRYEAMLQLYEVRTPPASLALPAPNSTRRKLFGKAQELLAEAQRLQDVRQPAA